MAGETVITVVGNLTADPELRWTNNGVPLANFSVASTPRVFDRKSNEWRDGEALFLRCTVWREYAEHVGASLTKGMRVIVTGELRQRNYEVEGQRRTSYELEVHEIGPALRYGTAQFTRSPGRDATQSGFSGGGQATSRSASQSHATGDSWAGSAPQQDWASQHQQFDTEAPF